MAGLDIRLGWLGALVGFGWAWLEIWLELGMYLVGSDLWLD